MRRLSFSALAVAFLVATVVPVRGADGSIRVVVHPQVKGNQISRANLATIFLRQAPRWGDGTPVLPVDQSFKSPLRSAFSRRLLGKSLLDVQVYWQRQIASGVTPPPVKASDQEVLAYVASTPGAIGYVSGEAPLTEGVKVIDVVD